MKTLLFALALFLAHDGLAQTNNQLRAFILPITGENLAIAEAKSGFVVGDQYLLIFQLKNGDEFGRQVPTVWVSKKGFKWKTCIISETHLLGATVRSVNVSNGELIAEFTQDGTAEISVVRIKLIPRNDLGVVFLNGVGLEVQQEIKPP